MGAQGPGQAWISLGKEVPQREGRRRGGEGRGSEGMGGERRCVGKAVGSSAEKEELERDRKYRSVCEVGRSEPEKGKCVGVTEGKRAQRRDQWRALERRRERE